MASYPQPISSLPLGPIEAEPRERSLLGRLTVTVALAFVELHRQVLREEIAALIDERREHRTHGQVLRAHLVDGDIARLRDVLERRTADARLLREARQ